MSNMTDLATEIWLLYVVIRLLRALEKKSVGNDRLSKSDYLRMFCFFILSDWRILVRLNSSDA